MITCDKCGGYGCDLPDADPLTGVVPERVVCDKCHGHGDIPTIKGLLIDPSCRTISEVEIAIGDGCCLESMYEAMDCDYVDVCRGGLQFLPSAPADDVWYDEAGLYSDCDDCFTIPGLVQLIGKGLILGFDDDGNSRNHTLTMEDVEELRSVIVWSKRQR